MKMLVGIVTATQSLLLTAVEKAWLHSVQPLSLAVHANGFEPDLGAIRAVADVKDLLVTSTPQNVGVTLGFHRIWQKARGFDLLAYMHDDLDIHEDAWDRRVISRFEKSPKCALVTFGGALGLGSAELYRQPYALQQLGRHEFMSNMRSAERHGHRETNDRQVATLDSFSMIVRTSLLDQLGGWDWYPYPCHNIDNALACQVRRRGLETWLVPVDCEHHGGETSAKPVYRDFAKSFGGDAKVHADSHVWLYNEFRDVLPFRV